MSLSLYLKHSSHRFYGAVTALVMLVLYEIFIVWELPSGSVVRNAPEAWFRTVLNLLGMSYYHISFLMIGASLIAIPVFYRSTVVVQKRIVVWIVVESIFWGMVSGFIIQLVVANLFFMAAPVAGSVIRDLGLAIGAGLFEELFFRVILTTLLFRAGMRVFRKRWVSMLCAILTASLLFSLAHYVGSVGDSVELYSFLFRFFAGIWFTTLYSIRGFSVVCLTHAFYDVFVLLF